MILVVISACVFEDNESACLQRIMEEIRTKQLSTKCLLLDQNFPKKDSPSSVKMMPVSHINIADWIDDAYLPIKEKMRAQARKLSKDRILLFDVRHYDPNVITGILHEATQVWFHLNSWQPAFVLIADDFHAVRFTCMLPELFYVQPLSTSKHAIQVEARNMSKQIMFYRWLGLGRMSSIARSMSIILIKLKHYVRRKIV